MSEKKKNLVLIVFFSLCIKLFLFQEPLYSEESHESEVNNGINMDVTSKILRIVTDQIFEDLMSKFGIIFSKAVNIVKFRENSDTELTLIFEEICQKSDVFKKKGLENYEPQVLVTSREMNQYEQGICGTKFLQFKLGNYAFLLLSRINVEKNKTNLVIQNSLDFSIENIAHALIKKKTNHESQIEEENLSSKWSEIDKFLPDANIKIYGPKFQSAFFNYLQNNFLIPICANDFYFLKYQNNLKEIIEQCSQYRFDSIYIEDDKDYKLGFEKMPLNQDSIAILPYHFEKRLRYKYGDVFARHNLDGVSPTKENIENGLYPLSFPIYIFISKNEFEKNTLLRNFITEILSIKNSGENGILSEYGLVSIKK